MSVEIVTHIANKLHLFEKREKVNQTQEIRMFEIVNFHKRTKKKLKNVTGEGYRQLN